MDHSTFILSETLPLPVPLVPEISLYVADDSLPLWQKTEEELGEAGVPPPFWAFAWAGGQALARFILDNPDVIAGKRVLDFASGSGLVAIAAKIADAKSVIATEIDPFALAAIKINARHNKVEVGVEKSDTLADLQFDYDILLAGDVFYEKDMSIEILNWFEKETEKGRQIYVGDPGRNFFPKNRMSKKAHYQVPVTRALEDADIKNTRVWTFSG